MSKLIALGAALLLVTLSACSGGEPGIGLHAVSSFRLVGASTVIPPDAVPAETQSMANELLGDRWGNFGLNWDLIGNDGQLELQPGEFNTSTENPEPENWAEIDLPGANGQSGVLSFSGSSATYTMQFAEAGEGFTDLTVAGTIDGGDAYTLVESLYDDGFTGYGETDRAEGSMPVYWTISGLYLGVPFTAQFEQQFFVERYVYGEAG